MSVYIIKMTNDGVDVSNRQIPLSKTNLPVSGFAFVGNIYWEVEIIESSHNSAEVRVSDYQPRNLSNFEHQEFPANITELLFFPFSFYYLQNQISVTQPGLMRNLCYDHPRGTLKLFSRHAAAGQVSNYSSERQSERAEQLKIWKEDSNNKLSSQSIEFRWKYADAEFENGAIGFQYHLEKQPFRIRIENPHLRKEFELLKDYISKKSGRLTFDVKLQYSQFPEVKIVTVASDQIATIDASFIDNIRILQIRSLIKIEESANSTKVISLDEIFTKTEVIDSNIFATQIEDVIQVLTDNYSYRNSEELKYLSNLHDFSNEKIYISLKPYFGFIFFYQTDRHCYFIWELLETHATYTWGFAKEIHTQSDSFKQVEEEINKVHAHGRIEYKDSLRTSNPSFIFKSFDHDNIEQKPLEAFKIWQAKLLHHFQRVQ